MDDDESFIEPLSTDINILLLGPSGVGKTTFINAFINYMYYGSLDEAIEGELKVVIPTCFTYMDEETLKETRIVIGEPDDDEKAGNNFESATRRCRSYVFRINGGRLRFIDTPGIGDTRGPLQDEKNLEDMLAYIDQFGHLNGVCILSESNQKRKTQPFCYCINELLRHLHKSLQENLMFVFTHAENSSFGLGESVRLIRDMLDQLKKDYRIEIPFNKSNVFTFDNAGFRYSALVKNGITLPDLAKKKHESLWKKASEQVQGLITWISKNGRKNVSETVSLNRIQQLIRKLSRPVAEIARLIEENKQLASDSLTIENGKKTLKSSRISQLDINVTLLDKPRTVCANKKHTEVVFINGRQKINYKSHCHPECYLDGVEEELIADPKLLRCHAIDETTGNCKVCGCSWKEHMHITYEIEKFETVIDLNSGKYASLSAEEKVNQLIKDLEDESKTIMTVSNKLMQFLRKNSLVPINDHVVEYLNLVLKDGTNNDSVIIGLERLKKEYEYQKQCMDELIRDDSETISITTPEHEKTVQLEEIDGLIKSLFKLPINGQKIQKQVERLMEVRKYLVLAFEKIIDLPPKSDNSTLMQHLSDTITQTS